MTKKELAEIIAANCEVTKKKAEEIINFTFNSITSALKVNEEVRISDFGTFKTTMRAERNGVNPKTGEKIKIPSKVAAVFKPAAKLREAVN